MGEPEPAIVDPSAPGSSARGASSVPIPEGAPAGASAKETLAGAPARDSKGRFPPRTSGNPKGRPAGTPNMNKELLRAIKSFRLGDKSYLHALLVRSLQNPDLAKKVIDKAFADATPIGPAIVNNNSLTQSETHVRIAPHLADPAVRSSILELTRALATRGAFAGGDGHVS